MNWTQLKLAIAAFSTSVLLWAGGPMGCQKSLEIPISKQTSVVMIIIDTLRADHVSSYGYPYPTTPVIDQLAHTGVQFNQFYANAPWTRPSIASMLTGLYPRTTGVHEERYDALAPDLTLLSERLQARGYYTLQVTSNPNTNEVFGFRQGFDAWMDSKVVWKFVPKHGDQKRYNSKNVRLDNAQHTTNRTLDLLRTHRKFLDEQPFYLQVLYIDPHFPYTAPEAHLKLFATHGVPHPEYDGDIHFADYHIGRLFEEMTTMGLMEDTLIVITSDHGEGLSSHRKLPKSTHHGWYLYDSTLHIPLILHHPGLPSTPKPIDTLASGIDLLPTLLELLGIPTNSEELPGRSLAGEVLGTHPVPPVPYVFSESDWRTIHKASIRNTGKTLIHNMGAETYQVSGLHEGTKLRSYEDKILGNIPIVEYYESTSTPKDWSERLPDDEESRKLKLALDQWRQSNVLRPPIERDVEDVTTLKDGTHVPSPYNKTNSGKGGQR